MGCEFSVAARVEITKKYARAYAKASKKDRGRLLDEVVSVTGWSRDNARRRLSAVAKPGSRLATKARKPRGRKFSYDATKTLQRVWAFSGESRAPVDCHAGLVLVTTHNLGQVYRGLRRLALSEENAVFAGLV